MRSITDELVELEQTDRVQGHWDSLLRQTDTQTCTDTVTQTALKQTDYSLRQTVTEMTQTDRV